ncbi:hypothetical protein ACIBG7_03615 [Nonomuraea sp. NPDC050328]|uniref:hypothetical protein n=1 Tax=Nonomuraea sp. NPDC050328 TaxID=3364361 RepID=UPI0037A8C58C
MTHSLRRAGAALVALLAGLLVVLSFTSAAQAAAAPPDAATVLNTWKSGDPLFVESGSPLTSDQQSAIRDELKGAKSKVYAVAMPKGAATEADLGAYFRQLGGALDQAGRTQATVAVMIGTQVYADSSQIGQQTLNRIIGLSANNAGGDVTKGMAEFVERVDLAAAGKTRSALSSGSVSGSGGGTGVLLALGGLALVGGGGYFLYSRNAKKKRLEQEARDLAAVKTTVEEDVTKFGEEITDLDADVSLQGASGQHIGEWQTALDAYERSKTQLATITKADQIREVTQTLEDGRYALAVVKAKVNNLPIPERRAPCFFNPQHGPSVRDVRWAPPGGAVREVPACAMDAQAVEQGYDPHPREVMIHGQRVPYYNAGPAYQPYAYGYYGGFGDIMTGMFIGTMMGSMLGGGFGMGMGGYGAGYSEGYSDAGGGDFGGGGDAGGWGDFGGGDFGGGDFGGGDW